MKDMLRRDGDQRTLIHFPIVHTQTDMGRLRESVKRATISTIGRQGWKRNVCAIDRVWTKIEQAIEGLALSYKNVRLYQDGLPVCDREMEIINELAQTGSRNHQLLVRLRELGATVMGTESPELLVHEYQLVQQSLAARSPREAARIEARQRALSQSVLTKRDQFIARRISSTLTAGETGILFLGMLHSVEGWLDKDIEVIYPMTQQIRL